MAFWNDPQQETSAVSMTCPWCGEKMELGYLYSGDSIRWVDRKPGAILGVLSAGREIYVSDEGVIAQYKKCWHCSVCGRLVVQLSNEARPSSQECWDEFRRYAEQAKGRK